MSSLGGTAGSVSVTTQGKYNLVEPTYADGAATELQTDSKGNLRVVIEALGTLNGQKNMAGSIPVVLPSDQAAIPVTGAGAAALALDSNLTSLRGQFGTLGQKNMAGSAPVVLASDQAAIPVTANAGTNLNTSALALDSNLTSLRGQFGTLGQKNMAGSAPVVLASDQAAIPVTGAGAAALALDSNLTSLRGQFGTLGQKNMAGSAPVVFASDQSALSVTPGKLSVLNEIDVAVGPVLDTSVNNIASNVGAFLVVSASLGNACKQIKIADTTGVPIGVYVGAPASEVLKFIINPGMDDIIEHAIAATSRVTLRSMQGSTINSGLVIMQFQG